MIILGFKFVRLVRERTPIASFFLERGREKESKRRRENVKSVAATRKDTDESVVPTVLVVAA